MLNQWPSVCCEDRERFSAALFAKSHSLRCDSSAGQTHTHTHTHSPNSWAWTVEIIIGLFSIEYENILTNKACILGLYLSHGTSVTKSYHTLQVWDPGNIHTAPSWCPSFGHHGSCHWNSIFTPRNRGFTYITARLLTPDQQLLLSKESWLPSERCGWGLFAFSLPAAAAAGRAHPHEHLKGHIQNHHKQQ